jgi:hypothetical protein
MTDAPELTTTLARNFSDLSDWIKVAAESTGAFVSREAPLFVQEYLRWTIVYGAMQGILGIIVVALFVIGFRWSVRRAYAAYQKTGDDLDFFPTGIGVLIVLVPVIFYLFGCVAPAVFSAVKAYVAPRVMLVEKAADLTGIKK